MVERPESWDHLVVVHSEAIAHDASTGTWRVNISGDWTYPEREFRGVELAAMLSWLGKAGWELVSVTQVASRQPEGSEEEITAYMRRPTRFAGAP